MNHYYSLQYLQLILEVNIISGRRDIFVKKTIIIENIVNFVKEWNSFGGGGEKRNASFRQIIKIIKTFSR